MIEEKINNKYINIARILFSLDAIALLFICIIGVESIETFLPVLMFILGINKIGVMIKYRLSLINPITIISIIWFILVPITSYEYPAMEKMTVLEWNYVIQFLLMFSIGGVFSAYCRSRIITRHGDGSDYFITKKTYYALQALLITSIVFLLVQTKLNGGFVAMSENNAEERLTFLRKGMSTISNLGGILPIFLLGKTQYKKNKAFIFLSIIEVSLQILSATRFCVSILLLMLLSNIKTMKTSPKKISIILSICIGLVIVFVGIDRIRNTNSTFVDYLYKTGNYHGDVTAFNRTKIFRYIGMSQRTMDLYIDSYYPGITKMQLTLFPVLRHFIAVDNPSRFGIWGYTATNCITNLVFDAGKYWFLLAIVLSYIYNRIYIIYLYSQDTLVYSYLWAITFVALTLSFYAYIYTFSTFYFEGILITLAIELYNRHELKLSTGIRQ